ncbi:McrB family protein [Vibrio breoganii]
MNKDQIFQEIIQGAKDLIGNELQYISSSSSTVVIESVEEAANGIMARRGANSPQKITFDRLNTYAAALAKGRPIHTDTVYNSGGNDRTIIETIVCHLPKVGFMKGRQGRNQTKNKVVQWFPEDIHPLGETLDVSDESYSEYEGQQPQIELTPLPKPFILLAGISGTGKTRFIREQAKSSGDLEQTYRLVSVRPDWHEPSDLLGYISRLGKSGAEYIATDVLKFIVQAWLEIIDDIVDTDSDLYWKAKELESIRPFWLCLDEMNLAPVEQYFADYLSVMETRTWYTSEELDEFNDTNGTSFDYYYECDPLLKSTLFDQLESAGKAKLRRDLGLEGSSYDNIWRYFQANGISLPFNLIVAGTVNMDETTHGFSRKVIDRALTIDFGMFYPNDFFQYFEPQTKPRALGYPTLSHASLDALKNTPSDPNGEKSINFLSEINSILKGTPFELAYRALNELLLSVICSAPENDALLQATWDDFLMCKILPRIEGDADKLASKEVDESEIYNEQTLLSDLEKVIQHQLNGIWDTQRQDLLREPSPDSSEPLLVPCRSKAKLEWMQKRLQSNSFASFWP